MTQINLDTLPRTRKEAQALGSKYYFTGKPCKRGHLAERRVNGGCVLCQREVSAAWDAANRERKAANSRAAYLARHEEIKARHRNYGRENREYMTAKKKEYYYRGGKDKQAEHRRKRSEDPGFRARIQLSCRINAAVRRANGAKAAATMDLTGCTLPELRAHLESQFQPGMTWDNWTTDGWHIDHIIPCASFDLTDPEQQKACFHYTNLQPLWAEDNLKKGARLAA